MAAQKEGLNAPRRVKKPALGRLAGVVIGLVIVSAYLAMSSPLFLTQGNLFNIFRAQSVVFILAIGATFIILTGGLDLSVASATGASAMILGIAMQAGWGAAPSILACVGAGIVLGTINGALVGVARISFFVVTLGTLSIYQSFALLVTNGSTISLFQYERFDPIQTIANSSVGGVPISLIVVAAFYLVAWAVLHRTRFGRAVYAVGSNAEAARLNGISVPLTLVIVYGIGGLMAGLAAVQQTGRLTATSPIIDPNLMLTTIAAVLIGGMSLRGGEGGLLGTVLGVLFLGVIQNGLSLSDVSAFWQGTVTGLILILAVGLAVLRESEVRRKATRIVRRIVGRSSSEAA